MIKNKSMAKHPLHVSYRYKTWTILVQHSRCLAIPKSTDKHAHEYRGRSLEYCQLSSAAKLRNVNKQQTLIFYQRKLNGRLRLICSIRLQSYAFFLIYANLSKSFFVKDYHAVLFLLKYVLHIANSFIIRCKNMREFSMILCLKTLQIDVMKT